jgi:hypothetical protein
MKELVKGEYLAPEAEVVTLSLGNSVLQVLSPGADIDDSTENPVVGW